MQGQRSGPLVETLHVGRIALLISFFLGGVIVFLIAGALGPDVVNQARLQHDDPVVCAKDNCGTHWGTRIHNMSPMRQYLMLEAQIIHPRESMTLEFPMNFRTGAIGIDKDNTQTVLAARQQHTSIVRCHAGRRLCSPTTLFTQSHISYTEYDLNVTFVYPAEAFQQLNISDSIPMYFRFLTVNEKYTAYETGWKYFLVTISLAAFITMSCALRPVARRTFEQTAALVLLGLLVFFNDPFFLAAIFSPGYGWPALYVFAAATFLTVVLGFIGAELHMIAKATDLGVSHTGKVPVDACFLVPKVLWSGLFWMTVMVGGMYTLYRLESDPAFSEWDRDLMANYIFGFGVFLLVVYTVYVLGATVSSVRRCGALRRQFGFMIVLTVTAVIILTALYYSRGYSFSPTTATIFLGAYGVANMFVYTLAISQYPSTHAFSYDAQMAEEPGAVDLGGDAFDEDHIVDSAAPDGDLEVGRRRTRELESRGRSGDGSLAGSQIEMRGGARRAGAGGGGFTVEDEDEEIGGADADDVRIRGADDTL